MEIINRETGKIKNFNDDFLLKAHEVHIDGDLETATQFEFFF